MGSSRHLNCRTHAALLACALSLLAGSAWLLTGCGIAGGARAATVMRAVLRAKPVPGGPRLSADAMRRSVAVLQRRFDTLAVTDVRVSARGTDRILVEMPRSGKMTAERQRQILQDAIRPARLEFIWLKDVKTTGSGNSQARYSLLDGARIRDDRTGKTLTPVQVQQRILYADPKNTIITGADLAPGEAEVSLSRFGAETRLKFNAAGTKRLGDFTRNHIGALLAIVVNGKIVQAPRIQDAIEGGLAVVTGTASTVQEAKDLADLLNAGALPVDLTLISLEQVPPPRR